MAQQDAPIVIEFFHDALSAWCYKASERLRALAAADPQLRVIQRCFPLATEPAFFSRLFPNKQEAKQEVVMVHWADARDFEPDPRIDCEAMMQADFDYPYSLPNLLGAKAAEMQGGQASHWRSTCQSAMLRASLRWARCTRSKKSQCAAWPPCISAALAPSRFGSE